LTDAAGLINPGVVSDAPPIGTNPGGACAQNDRSTGYLARNQDQVDLVASGISPQQQINARFDSVTGYEAYAANGRSQPYIQDTNGVRVVIVRDRLSTKGFRVDTAFPINLDR
jgi:hypothetical protein